jgi:hypothetical protein
MSVFTNPMLWAVIVGALAYCGILAACAMFGIKTAKRLQLVSTATIWGRLVRNWHSWFVPAMVLFLLTLACAMANMVVIAALLVAPYAFASAVGICREGRA